jgi:hypothetical protein
MKLAGTVAVQSLLDFIQSTTDVRHGGGDLPRDHPDSLLPGDPVAPD